MDRNSRTSAGRSPRERESGIALIATLLILALLLGLAVAMTTSIISDINLRAAYHRATAGFYAAESGLDVGMGGYRDLFLAFNVPGSADFQPHTVTVGNRTVTYSLADRNPTPGMPSTAQIPYGQVFGGLNAEQYVYTVTSSSTNQLGDTEASVGAEFQVGYIPLFQFVAFYSNDLEIDPGATMNLNGRVHTNSNLYLGPDGNLTISTNAAIGVNYVQVTAGGSIERGRKDTGACNTSPTLQVSTASNVLKTLSCIGSSTQVVPPATLATWGGTMQSGVTHINVPPPSITARGGGAGTYWGNADLRIALLLNTKWTSGHFPGSYPHKIAVLDSSGNIDTTKQTALENFIFQTPATSSPSFVNPTLGTTSTRPIFYTDAPLYDSDYCAGWTCTCTNARPDLCASALSGNAAPYPNCYCPNFQQVYNGSSVALTNVQRVYASTMTYPGKTTAPTQPADTDPRRGGFYNWREGRWTYLLNINVHDLLQWNMDQGGPFFSPSITTDGGVVLYATVYDPANPTANLYPNNSTGFGFGVRLFGSQTLPFPSLSSFGGDPTGISIASDRAMYVQGDYNAPPGAGGVYNPTTGWQPSSIVGDAMSIMSNNYLWPNAAASLCTNDCQSNRDLSDVARNASTTTVNAALLAGVDTTTSGHYNGGLENYPRFHEAWGGQTLNYLGSFVSLGTPQTVTGPWCGTGGSYTGSPPSKSGCNIYNPPARVWNFDPNFQNAAYIPPLTPRFVYVQQIRFTENFQ
ncbi:MAG: hypothetical protein ACHQ9S_17180 [Candidatus Binatia bacterium]